MIFGGRIGLATQFGFVTICKGNKYIQNLKKLQRLLDLNPKRQDIVQLIE